MIGLILLAGVIGYLLFGVLLAVSWDDPGDESLHRTIVASMAIVIGPALVTWLHFHPTPTKGER